MLKMVNFVSHAFLSQFLKVMKIEMEGCLRVLNRGEMEPDILQVPVWLQCWEWTAGGPGGIRKCIEITQWRMVEAQTMALAEVERSGQTLDTYWELSWRDCWWVGYEVWKRGIRSDSKGFALSDCHHEVATTEIGSLQAKQVFFVCVGRDQTFSFRHVKYETFISKDVELIMGNKSLELRKWVWVGDMNYECGRDQHFGWYLKP